jgi:CheY-like chemotaxis protein
LQAGQDTCLGDGVRLQQVFWNILKNAVKFTPEGGKITVQTTVSPKADELTVMVSDTGIGMTPAEVSGVFQAFRQGEHAASGSPHRFGGLGLGLAISRMLVELHSGKISAHSEGREHGATFTVKLPLTLIPVAVDGNGSVTSSDLERQPVAAPGRRRLTVLLVEDHEPTRTALAQLLARRRYEVKTAASVKEARSLLAIEEFDLLISDIGLPDGNGYDLMKEVQQGGRATRGIALTGYGMEQDVARGVTAGFVGHLVKPVRIQSLEAALAAAMGAVDSENA